MNRGSRWMSWAAVSAAAVVALAACVDGDEPEPSGSPPSPSNPSDEPTDEELLAEARSVYEGFRIAIDALYASDTPDYTRLTDWATDEVATSEAAAAQDLLEDGITTTGESATVAFDLIERDDSFDRLAVGVCEDVSSTAFIGPDGEDVTPAGRDPLVDLHVEFDRGDGRDLLVSAVGPWSGGDGAPCG